LIDSLTDTRTASPMAPPKITTTSKKADGYAPHCPHLPCYASRPACFCNRNGTGTRGAPRECVIIWGLIEGALPRAIVAFARVIRTRKFHFRRALAAGAQRLHAIARANEYENCRIIDQVLATYGASLTGSAPGWNAGPDHDIRTQHVAVLIFKGAGLGDLRAAGTVQEDGR